jgi:hypothetical protein
MKEHNSLVTPVNLAPASGLLALRNFRSEVGISGPTAWRWIKRGWLTTVNIAGTPYVTNEALAEFKRRAVAGEFAKVVIRKRNRARAVADTL